MIHVVAIITAKPGMRDAILTEFRANMPAVHAEQGCIEYGPAVDTDNSPAKFGGDTFVVIEKWESPRASARARRLAAHGSLWGEDPRHGGEPRDPHNVAGLGSAGGLLRRSRLRPCPRVMAAAGRSSTSFFEASSKDVEGGPEPRDKPGDMSLAMAKAEPRRS